VKIIIPAAVVLAIVLAVWRVDAVSSAMLARHYPEPERPLAVKPEPAMAADGARLAHLDGCTGCHGDALTGGVEYSGNLGTVLVAPNLTRVVRHRSDAELASAIRFGVKPDGTSLIEMPAERYLRSSDEDIAAVIAYLRSLPEKPDTAGKTRWGIDGRAMLAMGLMPASAEGLRVSDRGPTHTPSDAIARGRYLTQVHCSGCHGEKLQGEPEEDSPDLRFSIQHYSLAAFETFFTTGIARKGHGTDTMTPTIKHRLHYLTKEDVDAIFTYLNHTKAGE
jgi:mono/diheme cytochrome c family protein